MANETLFYILGGTLAVLAVVVSFLGLRRRNFPPSSVVMGGVVTLFALLVGGTAVFAVAGARDEQAHREAEEAEHAAATEHATAEGGAGAGGGASTEGPPAGGTVLQLAADPEALAFDKTQLTAKAGPVTIELDNPATIPHNVGIAQSGKLLVDSQTVSQSKTSVTTDLKAGAYEFLCTVPGHAEAGMKGTLTVE